MAACIDKGLESVEAVQEAIRHHVEEIKEVAATLDPGTGPCARREADYQTILARLEGDGDATREHMAKLMAVFRVGLFAGLTDAMPPNNVTEMTADERKLIVKWASLP